MTCRLLCTRCRQLAGAPDPAFGRGRLGPSRSLLEVADEQIDDLFGEPWVGEPLRIPERSPVRQSLPYLDTDEGRELQILGPKLIPMCLMPGSTPIIRIMLPSPATGCAAR